MKRKSNKGFTLAELLIVVAIIAVLVAISIPIFSNQIRKARLAVNRENARVAESPAVSAYITDGNTSTVYFCEDGTGSHNGYVPTAGTAYSYIHGKGNNALYIPEEMNITKPINQWTVDDIICSDKKSKAGDKVAKAWLVTVNYSKDYEIGIVALYDGQYIGNVDMNVGK
jgi:prepilin-type N-terminal cleavage/methylation domain-containing protein